MSDIKRVALTTLESHKVNEKVVKKQKTVRICVSLSESNEDKCPEYNYKDEVAAVKKKIKHNVKESNNTTNGLDSFDNDNDDDVRRIALEMEAKYGTGVNSGTKKRRRGRKDDYADIGAGYDETDSFIDNTDGYDEIIPPNVTTIRGGFYINSGALEFKTDNEASSEVSSSASDEDSESDGEVADVKSKRKRALDISDEEKADSDDSAPAPVEKQTTTDKPNISMHQAIKKKMFSHDKIQVKKRKLQTEQQKNTYKHISNEKVTHTDSDNAEKDSLKENKKPMKLSSIDDAIEAVISQKSSEINEVAADVSKPDEIATGKQVTPMETETNSDFSRVEVVQLPENLPVEILNIIENIKSSATKYKDLGKVKFFSGEVNTMLLNLERRCKVLGRSSRVKVYEHLAPFVKCRKETLIKRAKNLVIEDEHQKLKRTIEKLKNQVDQLMPSLMANHEKECQKVLHKKFSKEAVINEELKNLKAPRRRFPLSEDMRRMIRDIVGFKKRCFLHEGKPKDSLEDLLSEYLKKEILILWPDGWMSMAVLKKYCTSSAIKTPDPKSLGVNSNPNKHSQKSQSAAATSSLINLGPRSNLTITPVNLTDKMNEVSNNNVNLSSEAETVIKPVKEKLGNSNKKPIFEDKQLNTQVKSIPEKTDRRSGTVDNGVIVGSSSKTKDNSVPNPPHCQVIDLTDSPLPPVKFKSAEDHPRSSILTKNSTEIKSIENNLKNKFPNISLTKAAHDRDDVQKVMESLKALQQLSSPSKNEISSPVSVIAYNKNHSNSNPSQQGSVVNSDRTNFSGSIGFQEEFQKQFIGSINSQKTTSHSSKPSSNRCS